MKNSNFNFKYSKLPFGKNSPLHKWLEQKQRPASFDSKWTESLRHVMTCAVFRLKTMKPKVHVFWPSTHVHRQHRVAVNECGWSVFKAGLENQYMQLVVVAHKHNPSTGSLRKKDGQGFDVSLVHRVRSSLEKTQGAINTSLSLVFLSFGSCLKDKHFPSS